MYFEYKNTWYFRQTWGIKTRIESQSRSTISSSLRFSLQLQTGSCTNENSSSFIVICYTNSSFESHEAKFHRQSKLIFIYLLIFRQKNLLRRVILKRKLLEIGSAASCAKLIQDRRSFTLSVSKKSKRFYLVSWTYIYIAQAMTSKIWVKRG